MAQFNQPNYDRARKIEAAICPAGSRNLPVNQLRSAILSSLGGTNIDGRYICNAYAPLKRAITAEDVQEMRDLVSNIETSSDPFLTQIGDIYRLRLH